MRLYAIGKNKGNEIFAFAVKSHEGVIQNQELEVFVENFNALATRPDITHTLLHLDPRDGKRLRDIEFDFDSFKKLV